MNSDTKLVTVLLVDDHPILRKGLADVIENYAGNYRIISEAANGKEALEKITIFDPDIVILDIEMPEMDGFQFLKELKNSKPDIIILTAHKEEHYFNKAMDLGVMAYVFKESAIDDICDCLQMVSKGSYYISPELSSYLIRRMKKLEHHSLNEPSINDLTPTEKKILKLVSENRTSREIADMLFISDQTVNKHRSNISEKLNLHGTHSLIKFAIENKLLL